MDFWGRKSGPYIQALHFCLSLGLLTGPLLVDPLSQTHVPNVLQKALPFALSHPGKIAVEEWYCLIKHSRHFTLTTVYKGQLISKWFFGVVYFLQKTNKNKSTRGIIVVKSNFLVHFLGDLRITKSPFEIN